MNVKGEKPSFLSKRVVRTQLHNEWENIKLEEQLRHLTRERFNKSYTFIKRTQELNNKLVQIQKVKTKISVSPERRLFIKQHGFAIDVRNFEMDHFMNLLFDSSPQEDGSQPKPPLIRLNDIAKANEIERRRKLIENDIKVENIEDVAPPKIAAFKPTGRNNPPTKLRTIEPPKKGRDIRKVRMEKEREAIEGLFSKDQEQEFLEQVDIYRRRIVSKLNQNRRPATARPILLPSKKGKLVHDTSKNALKIKPPHFSPHGNHYKHDKQQDLNSDEGTKQLPMLSNMNKGVGELKSQRSLSVNSSQRSTDTSRREIQSAKCHNRQNKDYSEMRLNFQGKTVSLFVSKFWVLTFGPDRDTHL